MAVGGERIHVLHVDDERSVRDIAGQYLERESDRIATTTAGSAEEGLSILEGEEIDCVVSDYEMPGTDGIEFLRAVREDHPDLPFVLFTGRGSEAVASEAISAGVTDYLQKETGAEQYEILANRIENAVSEYRATTIAERYETVIEALGYPVYVVDETGTFQFVNEPFAEMTGYEVDEIVGNEPALIKDDATVERAENELGRLLSSDGPDVTRFEATIQPAEGEPIVCRDHMGVLPYEGEEFEGSVGILRDVTADRERERELARYERIIETAGDPVFSTDADGRITFTNGAFEDVTGRDAADLRGQPIADIAAGEDRERFEAAIQDVLDATDPGRSVFEIAVEAGGGDPVPMEVALTVLPGENGHRGTTGIIRDISQRKQREEELELKDRAMDEASVGITITGPSEEDCPLVYANEGFLELTGYDWDDVEGRNHRFLQGPETAEEKTARLREAIASEEPVDLDLLNYRADGTPFWNHIEITPVRNDADEVTHYVGFQRDVTDRKRRERKLRRRRERFETVVDIMDHDLLSHVNTATAGMELLKDSYDGSEVPTIERALDRIEEIADRGVTLARTGRVVDDPEDVTVADAAREAWEAVGTGGFRFEIRGDPGEVRADGSRYRQLLENLFRNAVEHGSTSDRPSPDAAVEDGSPDSPSQGGDAADGQGNGANSEGDAADGQGNGANSEGDAADGQGNGADVWLGPLADGDGFYVADAGPGIPEERRDQVFERGYTTGEDGSGFGLAIVAEIAAAHGWEVTLTGSREGGARFEFRTSAPADVAAE
ncbi:MAG: PAS domain S-box protein [Halobacteriales archaeon]